jgi:hypothetical protein
VTFSGAVVSAGVRLVGSHDSGPAAHRLWSQATGACVRISVRRAARSLHFQPMITAIPGLKIERAKVSTCRWFRFCEGGRISPQNKIGNAIYLKLIVCRFSIFRGPHKSETTDMSTFWVLRNCRKMDYLLKNSVIKTFKLTSCLRIEACFSRSVQPFRLFTLFHEELHNVKNQMISNNRLCHSREWQMTNLHILLERDTVLIWKRMIIGIYFVPSFLLFGRILTDFMTPKPDFLIFNLSGWWKRI